MQELIDRVKFYGKAFKEVPVSQYTNYKYSYRSKDKILGSKLLFNLKNRLTKTSPSQEEVEAEADTLIAKLHNLAENNLHGIESDAINEYSDTAYIEGSWDKYAPSTLAYWRNVEKIDKYELADKIQVPVLSKLTGYNSREDYMNFLNSDSPASAGVHADILTYLKKEEDSFKIKSIDSAAYISAVKSLLDILPQLPFDIQKAKDIRKPLHYGSRESNYHGNDYYYYSQESDKYTYYTFDANTPNFTNAAIELTAQKPFTDLVELHCRYAQDLKNFNTNLRRSILEESGKPGILKAIREHIGKASSDQTKCWQLFPDLTLKTEKGTAKFDIITVTTHGIFAIRLQSLGSSGAFNVKVEKDGTWKKIKRNGDWTIAGQLKEMKNLKAVSDLLDSEIPIIPITVFTNDVKSISNLSSFTAIRTDKVIQTITSYPEVLNETDIKEISETLLHNCVESAESNMHNWGKYIIQQRLEIYARSCAMYPDIQPMLDLAAALADISLYPLSTTDFTVIDEPAFTLKDNLKVYQKSAKVLAREKEQARRLKKENDAKIRAEIEKSNRDKRWQEEQDAAAEWAAAEEAERRRREQEEMDNYYYYYQHDDFNSR